MKNAVPLFLKSFVLACIFLATHNLCAQVKIGNNPATVNANSLLELESSGKGILLPRSTTSQITGMTNVPTGMILFNSSDSAIYLKRDTGWVIIPISKRGVNPTLQPATFADFYSLNPTDNTIPVFPGSAVQFPRNGLSSGSGIYRGSNSTFVLQDAGTYEITFEVSVTEPGQLMVVLNGVNYSETVVGRSAGSSQIVGFALITTIVPNSIISIINPPLNSTALTVTSNAGGNTPVSAHLIIKKLQ